MKHQMLFDKFLQGSLSASEVEELKALLKADPEAGRQFVDYVGETSLVVRVGSQLENAAAELVHQPVAAFRPEWWKPWWRWAGWAAGVAFVAIVVSVTAFNWDPLAISIVSESGNVVVLRRDKEIDAVPGMSLKIGDRLRTSRDGRARIQLGDKTALIELRGATHLRLLSRDNGATWELQHGVIEAQIGSRAKANPLVLLTPQAEAKVTGTEFSLGAQEDNTRLEVTRGSVQFTRREDGKCLAVHGGYFAVASADSAFTAKHLLPAPWDSQDVGAVGVQGLAKFEDGRCKVSGAGKDFCQSKDEFHFVYQTLEGDGEITARLVDLDFARQHAKAGVVMRRNLKTTAPHASLCLVAGGNLEFEHRVRNEARTELAGPASMPCWLRLVRRGDTITACKSVDGREWIEVGWDRFPTLGPRLYVGFGVTSRNRAALASSMFDQVSVTGFDASVGAPP